MIYGLVLAGGRSSRFGGTDKGLIPFRQKTMISSVIDTLRPQVNDLIISANANLETYQQFGYSVIPDQTTGFYGPLMGIYSAMRYISDIHFPAAEQVNKAQAKINHQPEPVSLLVVPCDMPLLPGNLKDALLNAQTHSQQISVVRENHRLQPLVLLLPLSHMSQLANYLNEGNHKVTDWVLSTNPAICDFTAQSCCFNNINSVTELNDAEKRNNANS